jgi:carbamoyltransferase
MYTLGINAAYHDPAACLVRDGEVIAAAEEERFTHVKHGKRPVPFSTWELPFHAIEYCLREAGLQLSDVDHVGYSYDPFLLLGSRSGQKEITLPLEPSAHPAPAEWESAWDPLFLSSIVNAPRHLQDGAPHHLAARFRSNGQPARCQWHFVKHHLAHAASAFLPSPYRSAAVMTLDGRGEKATTTYAVGDDIELSNLGHVNMPHSLGLLYEYVTSYLGFLHSSDEYKVMALASYGRPEFVKEFRDIVRLGDNGQYAIESPRLEERFGPARERGGSLDQRHFDIAHSLQKVLEDSVLEIASWLHGASGQNDLCMAGGVALNCVMNARVRDRGPFKNVWVQPAAGDAGTALGAAMWIDAQERGGRSGYRMDHAFLGPSYGEDEIEQFLAWSKLSYRRCANVAEEAASLLVDDKVIGWYQGRMEFGPRALGARSIIASPLHASMQAKLNEIKDREDFRPVAPVVLEEEAAKWFTGCGV